jgi:uncharacterized short protein YbdD (DUF466 family)
MKNKRNDKDNNNNNAVTFSSISNQQAVDITGEKDVDQVIMYEWVNLDTGDSKLFKKGAHLEEVKVKGVLITRTKAEFRTGDNNQKYERVYDGNKVKVVFRGKLTDDLFKMMTLFHKPLEGTELVALEEQYVEETQKRNPDKEITTNCTFKESRLYQVVDQEIDNKIQQYRVTSSTETFVNEDGEQDTRDVYFSYINLRTLFQPTDELPLDDCMSMFQVKE